MVWCKQVLLDLTCCHLVLMAFQMCMMPVLTPYLKEQQTWSMSDTETAQASSIFMFGVALGNILIGPVTDKKGRKIAYFGLIPAIVALQVWNLNFIFEKEL